MKLLLCAWFVLVCFQPASAGEWRYETHVDEMTDEVTSTAWLDSSDTYRDGWDRQQRVTLWVALDAGGQWRVALLYPTWLGPKAPQVTLRFDKEKAFEQRWDIGVKGEALYAPKPWPLLRAALPAKKFTVRVPAYTERDYTVSFDLSQLAEVVETLRKKALPESR